MGKEAPCAQGRWWLNISDATGLCGLGSNGNAPCLHPKDAEAKTRETVMWVPLRIHLL